MVEYRFKLVSSLEKNFFSAPSQAAACTQGSMLKNEIHSFQLIGQATAGIMDDPQKREFQLRISSELTPYIRVYQVGYVPVDLPVYASVQCEDYLSKAPGLYPDPLYPVTDGKFSLYNGQSRSLWITVDPQNNMVGHHVIALQIFNDENRLIETLSYELDIIDVELPELDIYNTGWFHGDCIAVLHGLELQSEEYFALLRRYLEVYAKFGHNTILTPIFTPPLDTAIGGERPTNQLVQVWREHGKYRFDFSLLKRWIRLCKECGLKYFEISHLYSQWGAKYAPKIMAMVNGEYKRIFGWETKALDTEYTEFLGEFLPQLTQVLTEEGILKQCLFHVSDEPLKEHGESYLAAKKTLTRYIDEAQLIDALGEYSLYENGTVRRPVVSNDHIHTFMKNGVEDLWAYYCCGQCERVSNRFMAMPSYRNRVLGAQLYQNRIKGFLQWGFNFWFAQQSVRVIDPYQNTSADMGFPAGDAFMVYPLDEKGNLICSLRLYVFNEALQDYRAMRLLETLAGRETVEELLGDIRGFDEYPRNSVFYLKLRETINRKIEGIRNRDTSDEA